MKEFMESVLVDPNSGIPESARDELLALIRENHGLDGLIHYFQARPKLAVVFRAACRDRAFDFVEQEIARLKQAKADRTITPEDINFAKGRLQSLLDSIERLCVRGIQRAARSAHGAELEKEDGAG